MTTARTTAGPLAAGALRRALLLALAALTAILALGSASASAAEPQIRVSMLKPDNVTPGKYLGMWVNVISEGDAPLSGNLTIKYTFPTGVSVRDPEADGSPAPTCSQVGQVDECVIDATGIPLGRTLTYKTVTEVDSGASGTLNGQIEVSGGGLASPTVVPLAFDTDPIGPFDVKSLDVAIADNPDLQPAQAAGAPDQITTGVELWSEAQSNFGVEFLTIVAVPENFRDVLVHVPPGLVGYPTATSQRCTADLLSQQSPLNQRVPPCPRDSQIGLALVNGKDTVPVFNLVPPHGAPAMFGFFYEGLIVNLRPRLRPSDNGIDVVTEKAPSAEPIPKFEVALWGVPADSSHDRLRAECTESLYGANLSGSLCPSIAPRVPFLRLPTSCSGPLPWSLDINSYQHPETFRHRATTSPAPAGCDLVPFDPDLAIAPSSSAAHSPTGLDVGLTIPQDNGPNAISQADLRRVDLALPAGVSINPAAAGGLEACSDAQLGLGLEGPATCPEAAKLGTLELDTPLLEDSLDGAVYLRTQNSQDPRSGEMYRLAIVLHSAERGVDVKLPGSLVVDEATGQLTTAFRDLPQLPFESMQLHLKTGPRAPLTTPQACGTYASQATLTGWNGKTVSLEPSFAVNQGCDAPGFKPGFEAGVANPTAGGYSPFALRVTRDTGMPNISRIEATLPEGELAKLAGVPVCSDAQAAAVGCPASSRIGSVVAGVGEGASPLYLPQPGKAPTAVYLAGPYKGAPYSVLAAVPAQSGPFDLGTVTVRSALRVDPETTQASVLSDPLPQIFGGIPVSYRDVRVVVDRPDFTLNPTSCEPKSVTATIGSSSGGSANVSDRFQVSDCAALAFKPKLALVLKGGTARGRHPALRATLTMPKGGANIARASVALPHSEFLAQNHIRTICTRVQFAAGAGNGAGCPKGSVYGKATAKSPLLDRPLSGPVYLRSSSNPLPDLVVALHGQIDVNLVGRIDSKDGGIRTTFANVPDAPVTKFVLSMQGGKKGLLENSTDICAATNRATAKFDGQNGKIGDSAPVLKAKCGKKKGKRERAAAR